VEVERVVLGIAGEVATEGWQEAVAFVVEDGILKDHIDVFSQSCGSLYGEDRWICAQKMLLLLLLMC
jgi:hypothetical protein